MSVFVCASALSLALGQAPAVAHSSTAPPERAPAVWGAALDVGVPDGAGASVVFRPAPWLRFAASGLHNAVSPGVRASATYAPFSPGLTPSLTLEGGHFFPGNANGVA